MRNKDYLFFLLLGLISLALFFYPYKISYKIDDFAAKVFYILNKDTFDTSGIAVVEIDDESIKKIDDQWPFRRTVYAQALEVLAKEGPKVVSFDLVFAGEGSSLEDDEAFIEALSGFKGAIVLAYFLDREGHAIYPKKAFKDAAGTAFINVRADRDRVIRESRAYYQRHGLADYSWSVKTAAAFLDDSPTLKNNSILIKDKKIPFETEGIMHINYLAKPDDFKRISFNDLLIKDFEEGAFEGKIVLISPTMKIAHDIHNTPLGYMPGTFIQANVIVNILESKFLTTIPLYIDIIILILTLASISYIVLAFSFLRRILLSIGVLLGLFWVGIGLRYFGWQVNYGRIAVVSLGFLVAANLYAYTLFVVRIFKIKNKIITDPLSNLYNLRYFIERLNFESRSIGRKKGYLIAIKLDDFNFLLKGEGFEKVRNIYEKIAKDLFSLSNLWAKYDPEVIVGRLTEKIKVQKLKKILEDLFKRENLKVKLRAGVVKVSAKINKKEIIPLLVNKTLSFTDKGISYFKEDEFFLTESNKEIRKDFFAGLYGDTEEKNRELLIALENLKEEEKRTKRAYLELMASLVNALESKDSYTQGHTASVCTYALMLADKIGLSEEEKEKIRKGAILHDLGKIGIPDAILHKKGPLTEEEFAIMRQHEEMSAKILEPISEFKDIIPYVLQHHENYDGTGYPKGISGENISLGARIIAVGDVFDALTTKRDYKKAFPVKEAVQELKNLKAKKLDPQLVDIFIEILKDTGMIK